MDAKNAEIVKCKGCGKEIFYITLLNGRKVPLDKAWVPLYFKLIGH